MKTYLNVAALGGALLIPQFSLAAETSVQKEIDALKAQNKVIMERLEASMDMMAKPASGHHGTKGKTSIGGYGELHYNNLDNNKAGGSDKKEIDFHRFVLFFGHEFNDDIRFFSEFELEHSIAGEGKNGEIELEQAYIEFDINNTTQAKGGLFLVPVGIINETHEPNTFYGVERNNVEKNIIPATWWEAGAALNGQFAQGWSYDVALTSGLDLNSADKVRSGRQKVSEARADSPMITGRLKYTGIAGLELGATVATISDYTQGQGTKNSATLTEAHAVYQKGGFGLRALYATWDVDGKTSGYDEQTGWYVEPSYRITPKTGVFARYSTWDNQAGSSTDTEYNQTDIGVNYWPHEDVVIKVDYQTQDAPSGKNEFDGVNVGIGYQF